jgi:hypothetical protein
MTTDERARIAAYHVVSDELSTCSDVEAECSECGGEWPCDAFRLLDELERVEAREQGLIAMHNGQTLASAKRYSDLVGERDQLRAALLATEEFLALHSPDTPPTYEFAKYVRSVLAGSFSEPEREHQ